MKLRFWRRKPRGWRADEWREFYAPVQISGELVADSRPLSFEAILKASMDDYVRQIEGSIFSTPLFGEGVGHWNGYTGVYWYKPDPLPRLGPPRPTYCCECGTLEEPWHPSYTPKAYKRIPLV